MYLHALQPQPQCTRFAQVLQLIIIDHCIAYTKNFIITLPFFCKSECMAHAYEFFFWGIMALQEEVIQRAQKAKERAAMEVVDEKSPKTLREPSKTFVAPAPATPTPPPPTPTQEEQLQVVMKSQCCMKMLFVIQVRDSPVACNPEMPFSSLVNIRHFN